MSGNKINPSVHEVIIEELSGRNVLEGTVEAYIDLYGGGNAKCPVDGIPALIEAFKDASIRFSRLKIRIKLAIENLESQLKN